jgi:predicted ribosome quality control (RQC) complex YloA/Tae2 family protein
MKQDLSSLDLYYLIKEFSIMIDAKIDKFFQHDSSYLVQLHLPGKGKHYLTIKFPSLIYLSEHKESYEDSGNFGITIRKHIKSSRIRSIEQLEFERIIKFTLQSKDSNKYLYVELFKPGNIILTNEDNKIIMAAMYKGFGSRLIRPGAVYEYPKKDYNFLDLKEKDLAKLIEMSDKSSIVVTLAVELGLGGIYAEELLEIAKVDKTKPKLDLKEIKRIYKAIDILKNKEVTLNESLDAHFTIKSKEDKKEKQDSKFDKKKHEMESIIRQQLTMIKGMEKAIDDNHKKGELIYEKYSELDDMIKQINKAKEELSDKEIKAKLKKKKIKYDEKKKSITLDL